MREYDFFYRNSFNLQNIYPKGHLFKLESNEENMILEDAVVRLKEPEKLTIKQLHTKVSFSDESGSKKIAILHVRCWIKNEINLKEVTRFAVWGLSERIQRKLFRKGYQTILLTKNGATYYSDGYHLCKINAQSVKTKISNGPKDC